MPKKKTSTTSDDFRSLLATALNRWDSRESEKLAFEKSDSAAYRANQEEQRRTVQRVTQLVEEHFAPKPMPLLSMLPQVLGTTASPGVPLEKPYTDNRGTITNIANAPVGSVVLITSEPGTTRAKHWHKADGHLCFVVSGSIEYYERPCPGRLPRTLGAPPDTAPLTITKHVFEAGEAFFTDSYMEHEMYFQEKTMFITLGRLSRTPEEYEKDLVRLSSSLRDEFEAGAQ